MSYDTIEPRSMLLSEFTPHVGKMFALHTLPEEVEIELVEAIPLRESGLSSRPPFQLIFRSAPDIMLVDDTYVMRAKGFEPSLIHINPIMTPPGNRTPGHFYQAVFN